MNARLVRLFARVAIVALLAFGFSIAAGMRTSIAAMDLSQQRHFDIEPQPLSSALLKFSAQSDIQVTVPGQLVEGKTSPGVVGTLNSGSALTRLLKDTSLGYDVVDGSTVVITAPSSGKSSRRDFQKVSNPVPAGSAPTSRTR